MVSDKIRRLERRAEQPFRFMDLPGELRNKVYALLLCSFGSTPDRARERSDAFLDDRSGLLHVVDLPHTNNPTILRTNSQIHREAYDVMIKTNRFIRVRLTQALPLGKILCCLGVAVVATGHRAAQSSGYLVDIFMSTYPLSKYQGQSCDSRSTSIIVRVIDLELFCRDFKKVDAISPVLSKYITMVIDVAPMLDHKRPWYRDDFATFFSGTTQKAILKPLLLLREIASVEFRGPVMPNIAVKLGNSMISDEHEDLDHSFHLITWIKELGVKSYYEGNMKSAISIWGDALMRLLCMRESKAWTKLMEMYGETSINRFATLQCSLGLNLTQAEIVRWREASWSATTETGLDVVRMCRHQGYWKDGYTWTLPNVLAAKYFYRTALCIRLWGQTSEAVVALESISQAQMLAPYDPAIPKEQRNIKRWQAWFDNGMANGDLWRGCIDTPTFRKLSSHLHNVA